MKTLFKVTILIAVVIMFTFGLAFADVWVNGYQKSNGTYVQGHYRSSPNSTTSDNYSTYPNVNPYTGKRGTKRYNGSSSGFGSSSGGAFGNSPSGLGTLGNDSYGNGAFGN